MAQRYDKVTLSRKAIFFNNIIGGIGWSIGATFGFALLVAIVGWLAKEFHFIPYVGHLLQQASTVKK